MTTENGEEELRRLQAYIGRYQIQLEDDKGNTEVFNLKPLRMRDMIKVMDSMEDHTLKELKEKDPEEYETQTLNKFMMNIGEVAVDTLMRSFPDLTKDEAEACVLKNMQAFMDMIFKQVNSTMKSDDKRQASKLRHAGKIKQQITIAEDGKSE